MKRKVGEKFEVGKANMEFPDYEIKIPISKVDQLSSYSQDHLSETVILQSPYPIDALPPNCITVPSIASLNACNNC